MAGYMYLGNKKVCPAIVVKQGTSYVPSYSVVDGMIVAPVYEYNGHEFDGVTKLYINTYLQQTLFRVCKYIRGDLVLRDVTDLPEDEAGFDAGFTTWGMDTIEFKKLENVPMVGLQEFCLNCPNLKKAYMGSITRIDAFGFYEAFKGCTNIEDIYFNSLTTNSLAEGLEFIDMMLGTGTSKTHTIHFPSNLEEYIQEQEDYPTFGGDSGYVVVAFDLPPTE